MIIYFALILGGLLSLINYFSDELWIKEKTKRLQAKSFAAGVSLTYIFLHLLPKAIPLDYDTEIFFAFILIGFVVFNLLEKFIYKSKNIKQRKIELKEEHTAIFIIYNFSIGLSLLFFMNQDMIAGVLFFIPLALHSLLSASSLRELHYHVKGDYPIKIFLSITPIMGILLSYFIAFPEVFHRSILGFVAGSLLYVVFRELIPRGKESYPRYFLFGIIAMIGFLTVGFLGG